MGSIVICKSILRNFDAKRMRHLQLRIRVTLTRRHALHAVTAYILCFVLSSPHSSVKTES